MSIHNLTLHVNGKAYAVQARPDRTLSDVLRSQLGLLGTHESCGIGICGACTVLVDGRAVSSCLTLAVQVEGCQILTIEGLAEDGKLNPVQQAFLDQHAFQCAYCTPGFILTTLALLRENPHPDEAAICEYLSGNLCRCGSYKNILKAVRHSIS